jgi:hypothetical protein
MKTKEPSIYQLLARKTRMTPKRVWRRRRIIVYTLVLSVLISSFIIGAYGKYTVDAMQTPNLTLNSSKKATVEPIKELTVKEYVKQEIEKAGLDFNQVDCLIDHESGWDVNKYHINNNKTIDTGLWEINSVHENIKMADTFNYKLATRWAIAKRLHDGNWNAWFGYLNNCK